MCIGNLGIYTGSDLTIPSSIGTHTYSFEAGISTLVLKRIGTGGTEIWLSNISVKEVYNIDGETYDGSSLGATYDDAQERIPQLGMMNWSKGSNLIEYSEDFSDNYWTKGSVTLESGYLAPDGTLSAYKVTADESFSNLKRVFTSIASHSRSIWAKTPSGTGTVALLSRFDSTGSIVTITNEWQRFEINTATGSFPNEYHAVDFRAGNLDEVILWGAQLENADSVSAYRRTNGTAVTDATLISCATDSQKDILGNAVRVKGSGFNLDGTGYAVNETLPTISNNISLSFWVKLDTFIDNNLDHIIGRRTGLSWLRIYRYQANSLAFEVAAGVNLGFTVNENQWVFVTATMDNNNEVKVYVDGGSPVTSTLSSGFTFVDTDPFSIGAWLNPNLSITSLAHGKIDDVQVYNRVLSSDEVEQNYNATKSGHNN